MFAVFAGGVTVGMKYHDFDVMCDNTPRAYRLKVDLKTDNGLTLPKGTIVPLQKCEYADRFSLKFYLPHMPEHIDAFTPFTPENKTGEKELQRGTVFQYGLKIQNKDQ